VGEAIDAMKMRVIAALIWTGIILAVSVGCSSDDEHVDDDASPAPSPDASLAARVDALEGLDFTPLLPEYLPQGFSWDAEFIVLDPRALHMTFFPDAGTESKPGLLELDIQEEFYPDWSLCGRCSDPVEGSTETNIDGVAAQEYFSRFPGILEYGVVFRVGDILVEVSSQWDGDTPETDAATLPAQEVAGSMIR